MWLWVYVPAVLGVLRYRHWPYWRWVLVVLLWQSAAEFLFSAHGSLDAPERDGLIMRAMRQATNDGPELALFGLVFLLVFWGGLIYFVRQLFAAARAIEAEGAASRATSRLRRGAEVFGLSALAAILLSHSFNNLTPFHQAEAAEAGASLETVINETVAQVNAAAPTKIDDITVLVGAAGEGRVMIFDFEITDRGVSREAFAVFLRDQIPPQACAIEGTQLLHRDGGALRYRYRLASGGEPLTLDLTATDCARVGVAKPPPPPPSAPEPSPPSPGRPR